MMKLAMAAAGCALLLGATPLSATPRRFAECRVSHPAYYFQSAGRRAHGNYRVSHFTRYHAFRYNDRYRYDDRRRFGNRYRNSGPYRYDYRPYRSYNYYGAPHPGPYRVRPYAYRRGFGPPVYRHRGHRPRIGIYLEF